MFRNTGASEQNRTSNKTQDREVANMITKTDHKIQNDLQAER